MSQTDLLLRGCVAVTTTEELEKKIKRGNPLRVKLGVDPTAADLHLGHTVPLRKMRRFQDLGHTGVLIVGDFTAKIGDPSGRIDLRPMLTIETIRRNIETYKEQAFKILDLKKTELRFNSEWLEPFVAQGGMLAYLQRVTHAQLTERQDFRARIAGQKPITMLEILYPIFQGYDSVAIKADVELGGTDQTFNLLFGRAMQQDFGQEPQVTITLPLMVGTEGSRKMSKTYNNAVALTDEPDVMFGKIMSIGDETMQAWAELLTNSGLESLKAKHPMQAKLDLAQEIVSSFYDAGRAQAARQEFVRVHAEGALPQEMPQLRLKGGEKLYLSQIIAQAKLAPSRKEAQRKITEGGVRLDGRVMREDGIIELAQPAVLSLGRRGFCRLIPD